MKDIVKPYNEYQTAHFKLAYSTNPAKRRKINSGTHWHVEYNGRVLTQPLPMPLAQEQLKQFRMMGREYPNKELLKVKPST